MTAEREGPWCRDEGLAGADRRGGTVGRGQTRGRVGVQQKPCRTASPVPHGLQDPWKGWGVDRRWSLGTGWTAPGPKGPAAAEKRPVPGKAPKVTLSWQLGWLVHGPPPPAGTCTDTSCEVPVAALAARESGGGSGPPRCVRHHQDDGTPPPSPYSTRPSQRPGQGLKSALGMFVQSTSIVSKALMDMKNSRCPQMAGPTLPRVPRQLLCHTQHQDQGLGKQMARNEGCQKVRRKININVKGSTKLFIFFLSK